ncbi:cyclic-phosphate processing receiver domain-containing protein [Paenibacillus mucilaginosus]|uniref:Ribosomal RNA methyltransferase RrmJ/FtsJ n=3 Tax=Paenibacillus mucilaginosus TaxID=61624 RepID=H6ND76_9BACL|nr:cyclic-phosphate processing receiver domain-containing protein [Paenibacillus mucilaginosus]AEI41500.1 ribosomal RNA methyltransferase RrmJ/FtsJ [Paenibacillus mucilaginosus KNP414]AFC30037.1 ribosomal RNA methyltransferase RrmJ/FtsJ [Paenibacillus mucilaginosus 3016]AFH62223.1 cell division protein FtsJ [Paenibacillus mucilaginosus K02]MCG7215460.1 cell division protein FtsJ [Paenibacillus mucilaginosus]WDM30511.1 cell division protein FtsJ [Paenibacillus mucilaginosus]
MIHVYMDDWRACPPGFVLARSGEECLLLLKECEVDILSLDFDLGWGQPSGLDLVHAMIRDSLFPRRIFLHSSSPAGRQSMYQALYASKPESVELSAGPVPPELLQAAAESAQE